jgi:hypothetical protein
MTIASEARAKKGTRSSVDTERAGAGGVVAEAAVGGGVDGGGGVEGRAGRNRQPRWLRQAKLGQHAMTQAYPGNHVASSDGGPTRATEAEAKKTRE